ncbi:MAG TPA: histidine triad nucleotide-binding protein [bacterium]|jgi:histidine triad (HIT) family protein|nr:histidine triad nucleotide-binding protein [Myxococcales bacterium]OQA61472.1 MAG: HIT-like protein [bacterium ADurb.Bin270]HPW45517.1 histidine triad nucleotide-binding protein [bacterium]HQC51130.1 histidine triad nucleotide-binding protein [bacterium]HQG14011.1 histidine triad nucleotide-binding protein [bacterium]
MAGDCIFCKIISGEIPTKKIIDDGEIIAFNDINPAAPTHILIIPKKHIPTINDIPEADAGLIGNMFIAAKSLAKEAGIEKSGYRTIINCLSDGGQEVFHLHLHLLGGRKMGKMG